MIKTIKINKQFLLPLFVGAFMFFFMQVQLKAQEKPPRPIAVYVSPVQGLSFGSMILGPTGGTIIVYPDGTRSSTGDVILGNFGFTWSPALFEIEANRGTLINILNGPNVVLTGSNGGTMLMEIGSSDPVAPFVITLSYPTRTFVRIGGTLTVGTAAANPEGAYSGSFMLTFIQE